MLLQKYKKYIALKEKAYFFSTYNTNNIIMVCLNITTITIVYIRYICYVYCIYMQRYEWIHAYLWM